MPMACTKVLPSPNLKESCSKNLNSKQIHSTNDTTLDKLAP